MRTVRIFTAALVGLLTLACDGLFVEPALAPASISLSAVPSGETAATVAEADQVVILVFDGSDPNWWSGGGAEPELLASEELSLSGEEDAFRARLELELDGARTVGIIYILRSQGMDMFRGLFPSVVLRPGARTDLTAGGMIFGQVVSATTGEPVSGAEVRLRQDGQVVSTLLSNDFGDYAFQVPTGSYTVEAVAEGFIAASASNVSVQNYTQTFTQSVLSPPQGEGETRIVLTWGELPRDLDSHITGPNGSGGTFHVFFGSRGSGDSTPFTFLDFDDVSSFGPETITITQQFAGTYCYGVHNFSGSPEISTSQAVVRVFQENEEVGTFSVPQGTGRVWTVFSLNGSSINTINRISNQSPPGDCGQPAVQGLTLPATKGR